MYGTFFPEDLLEFGKGRRQRIDPPPFFFFLSGGVGVFQHFLFPCPPYGEKPALSFHMARFSLNGEAMVVFLLGCGVLLFSG